ncbi:MAG: hypothetical protein ACOCOK_03630 [Prevotella sp.]
MYDQQVISSITRPLVFYEVEDLVDKSNSLFKTFKEFVVSQ